MKNRTDRRPVTQEQARYPLRRICNARMRMQLGWKCFLRVEDHNFVVFAYKLNTILYPSVTFISKLFFVVFCFLNYIKDKRKQKIRVPLGLQFTNSVTSLSIGDNKDKVYFQLQKQPMHHCLSQNYLSAKCSKKLHLYKLCCWFVL